jgi:hypothetical protein
MAEQKTLERKYTSELGDKIWGKPSLVAEKKWSDIAKFCLVPGSYVRSEFVRFNILGETEECNPYLPSLVISSVLEIARAYIYFETLSKYILK